MMPKPQGIISEASGAWLPRSTTADLLPIPLIKHAGGGTSCPVQRRPQLLADRHSTLCPSCHVQATVDIFNEINSRARWATKVVLVVARGKSLTTCPMRRHLFLSSRAWRSTWRLQMSYHFPANVAHNTLRISDALPLLYVISGVLATSDALQIVLPGSSYSDNGAADALGLEIFVV